MTRNSLSILCAEGNNFPLAHIERINDERAIKVLNVYDLRAQKPQTCTNITPGGFFLTT